MPIGEHDLSGQPSLAAVRTADAIGRETMGKIWFTALTWASVGVSAIEPPQDLEQFGR